MLSLRPMHFNSNENWEEAWFHTKLPFVNAANGQTACRFAAREIRRGSAEISSKEMVKGHLGDFKTHESHDFRIPNNHLAKLFANEPCPKERG